jgi:hypothetical protein
LGGQIRLEFVQQELELDRNQQQVAPLWLSRVFIDEIIAQGIPAFA